VDQSLGYGYLARWNGFLFPPKPSELSKSEPSCPHSILMQESKDMREKNIEPEIYREVKVTNKGRCVVDHDI
jgi:hypothetical protein